jgi:thiamine-phosphate pyrophosphorylase
MLLPEMTSGTRQALLASIAWQEAMQASELFPTQVLLGLLNEDEGITASLLRGHGITLDTVLEKEQISARVTEVPFELPVVLPALLTKLLYDARMLALESTGDSQVQSDHLLQALLSASPELQSLLEQMGFTYETYRSAAQPASLPITLDEPLKIVDTFENQSLARILDANANRAREALRVLEELARFHCNDSYLSGTAKRLRHQLTTIVKQHLPSEELLGSRDTVGDVGTSISTSNEKHRHSLHAVLVANAQRLQEALRSLEEYGKILSPEFGTQIERVRYQSYTLEKALFLHEQSHKRLRSAHLYLLISKSTSAASLEWTIQEAVQGGVSVVQLREKNRSDRELLKIAREVRSITREVDCLFIMNDRADLARLSQADGVHLGQDDLDVAAARSILGSQALIGVSTHNIKQVEKAITDSADYLGVGPTFPSQTKQFEEFPGLAFVREVASTTSLPAYAIGGISPENVFEVKSAGLSRVAVGNAITQAEEPRLVAQALLQALRS